MKLCMVSMFIEITYILFRILEFQLFQHILKFISLKIKNFGKIGTISKSELIITDPEDGTVSVYNTRSNKSEIVVTGLNNPQYVSIARTLRGVFHIITERNGAVYGAFKIYGNDWNLYSNIDGNFSGQTAVTDMETILVAEEGYFSVSQNIAFYTGRCPVIPYYC